jgi:membrane complex biogenesis BtpA family protein
MGNAFIKLFAQRKPLIGMIHLPLLPGYQGYQGEDYLVAKALKDLVALEQAGIDGVLIENHEGIPGFVKATNEIKTVFESVIKKVMTCSYLPVGMEIIYDMPATVKIASEVGCDFVRLDVFADTVLTRWGIVGESCGEVKKILQNNKNKPLLLTDVHVKHAKVTSGRGLKESLKRSLFFGSDGLVITGPWTGLAPRIKDLKLASKIGENKAPVIVGSGLSSENALNLLRYADGAIVGTSIKAGKYIDLNKAQKLIKLVKSIYKS